MENKEKKENIICQRCQKNQISFCCSSCPKPFDKLCSECDTYVHSIIPYKKLHQRISYFNNNLSEQDSIKENNQNLINEFNIQFKELKEKNSLQIDIINKLKTENNILRNNMSKLIEQNNNLNNKKEEYVKEINYLKNEIEQYKNENKSLKIDLDKSCKIINELNNNLRNLNNDLEKKEIEIEEIKNYFNNKINNKKNEEKYLLKVLDNSNCKLIEKNDISYKLKEENDLLKKRLIKFEEENLDNLKLISQLHKENKTLYIK